MGAARSRGTFAERRAAALARNPPKPSLYRGLDGKVCWTDGRDSIRLATETERVYFESHEARHTPTPGQRLAIIPPSPGAVYGVARGAATAATLLAALAMMPRSGRR